MQALNRQIARNFVGIDQQQVGGLVTHLGQVGDWGITGAHVRNLRTI